MKMLLKFGYILEHETEFPFSNKLSFLSLFLYVEISNMQ